MWRRHSKLLTHAFNDVFLQEIVGHECERLIVIWVHSHAEAEGGHSDGHPADEEAYETFLLEYFHDDQDSEPDGGSASDHEGDGDDEGEGQHIFVDELGDLHEIVEGSQIEDGLHTVAETLHDVNVEIPVGEVNVQRDPGGLLADNSGADLVIEIVACQYQYVLCYIVTSSNCEVVIQA